MTEFIHAEIPLFDGLSFHVDGNSKITAGNGTYSEPKPNAFSLPHISTCPGSTPACRSSCYVHGLEANAKEVYCTYQLNAAALHRVLMSWQSTCRAADALSEWIDDNCTSFRWHVSGDVFSDRYARFIARVCRLAPDVQFWIYTRSFWFVGDLLQAPNLVINLSADEDNLTEALETQRAWRDVLCGPELDTRERLRICYMTRDGSLPKLSPGSVIFPDYALRGRTLDEPTDAPWWQTLTHDQKKMVCPSDFFGQSEHHRCGPCNKCMVQP